MTNDRLRHVFGQFGEVEDASIATEKGTGKSRGFAFVTMKWLEGAQVNLSCVSFIFVATVDGRSLVGV
jgi:hypothetical protein